MSIKISKKQKIYAVSFIILIALIIGWFVAWNNGVRDYLYPKRWGMVEKGLVYRSGRLSPNLIKQTLQKYQIKTIVNLCGRTPKKKPEVVASKELGIKVYTFPMSGNGIGKPEQYVAALKVIVDSVKKGQAVQVHCAAGSYRTGAVTALYQMLIEKKSPETAYQEMLKYNYDPTTTKPYGKLLIYLNKHMKFIAEQLKRDKVIKSLPNPIPQLPLN